MYFAAPLALFGLFGIIPIILLGFLRIRPARMVVPSLIVWRLMPERQPPLKEMKRPRFSAQLFLQIAAFTLAVLAIAQPFVTFWQDEPRHVVIALDASPRMLTRHADGRTSFEKGKEQIELLLKTLTEDDAVHFVIRQSELYRLEKRPSRLRLDIMTAGAPGPFAEVVTRAAEIQSQYPDAPLYVITDRTPDTPWPGRKILVGSPDVRNIGIVDATPDGFVRLVNTGPARNARLRVDGVEQSISVPSGSSTLLLARGVRDIRILDDDSLPEDNSATASLVPGKKELGVSIEGEAIKPQMLRALQAIPGVKIVPSGADVRFLIRQATADWSSVKNAFILLPQSDPPAVREPRVERHFLLEGMPLSQIAPKKAHTVEGGTPLISDGRRPIAAVAESDTSVTVALGFDPFDLPPDKWTWLPILLARYFEMLWARESKASSPIFVRAGSELSLGPRRSIRIPMIGPSTLEGISVTGNILEESESKNRGEWSVPSSYALEQKSARKASPWPLDAPLLVGGLALLALAFAFDLRRRG